MKWAIVFACSVFARGARKAVRPLYQSALRFLNIEVFPRLELRERAGNEPA